MQKNFKIMNEDIKAFISNPDIVEAYSLKHKEALFCRYMDESEDITIEGFNILFNKYHNKNYLWCSNLVINEREWMNSGANFTLGMRSFKEYVALLNYEELGIKHLDYISASLILISMLSKYEKFNDTYSKNQNFLFCQPLDDFYNYFKCDKLFKEVYDFNDKEFSELNNSKINQNYDLRMALNYYCLADLVICDDNGYRSIMNSKYADKEVEGYKNIYGIKPVEIVERHVKSL